MNFLNRKSIDLTISNHNIERFLIFTQNNTAIVADINTGKILRKIRIMGSNGYTYLDICDCLLWNDFQGNSDKRFLIFNCYAKPRYYIYFLDFETLETFTFETLETFTYVGPKSECELKKVIMMKDFAREEQLLII